MARKKKEAYAEPTKFSYIAIFALLFVMVALSYYVWATGHARTSSEFDKVPHGPKVGGAHKNKKGGKREEQCRDVLQRIFGVPFPTIRPTLLTNPRTGKPCEFDGYNAPLKLAFEYQDEQHEKCGFGMTPEQLNDLIERDRMKAEKALEVGITLIIVKHSDRDIERTIRNQIPDMYLIYVN